MTIDARLISLGQRHRELDTRITEELQRPAANDQQLFDMKRRKLAIKDQMRMLEAQRRAP